jgi:hypothetical protein
MCVFIRVQDLAAYALVEELKNNPLKRVFTFHEIESYGIAIEKFFKAEKESTVYLTTKPYREDFCNEYSDCFTYQEATTEESESIRLKDDVTIDTIREKMVSYMPLRMLAIIYAWKPEFFSDSSRAIVNGR